MRKALSVCTLSLSVLYLSGGLVHAQQMSTPADRILRPGDIIQWDAATPHRLRVGGTGQTSLSDVDKTLSFTVDLTPAPGNARDGESDTPVTATVKDGADTQGVATFVFTCGAHPSLMRSQPFTFEAKPAGQNPRTFAIKAGSSFKWVMEKPDGSGQVQVGP